MTENITDLKSTNLEEDFDIGSVRQYRIEFIMDEIDIVDDKIEDEVKINIFEARRVKIKTKTRMIITKQKNTQSNYPLGQ